MKLFFNSIFMHIYASNIPNLFCQYVFTFLNIVSNAHDESNLCIYSSVNSSVMILFELVALFKDKTKRSVSSFL